nr:hypothetical protein Iba_chr13aCG9460 [Ipomoea batatas]
MIIVAHPKLNDSNDPSQAYKLKVLLLLLFDLNPIHLSKIQIQALPGLKKTLRGKMLVEDEPLTEKCLTLSKEQLSGEYILKWQLYYLQDAIRNDNSGNSSDSSSSNNSDDKDYGREASHNQPHDEKKDSLRNGNTEIVD